MSDNVLSKPSDVMFREKRAEIFRLAARHGATRVRWFGSMRRGEARLDSDIDFLVEMAPDRSLLDRIALIQDLEDLLGCPVDVVTDNTLQHAIRSAVLQQAVRL